MQRIMAVDDSESIRQMVAFALEQGGYTIIQAQNGRKALKKLKDTDVDMIITDLDMPEMDGISLIKQVRSMSAHQKTPILILTTKSDGAIKDQVKALGANGWIIKPFRPKQLLAVVQNFL